MGRTQKVRMFKCIPRNPLKKVCTLHIALGTSFKKWDF